MSDPADKAEMGKTFTALVRVHEANCRIDFPSEQEQNFRIAIMKKLAAELSLRELLNTQIAGPGRGIARPVAAGKERA